MGAVHNPFTQKEEPPPPDLPKPSPSAVQRIFPSLQTNARPAYGYGSRYAMPSPQQGSSRGAPATAPSNPYASFYHDVNSGGASRGISDFKDLGNNNYQFTYTDPQGYRLTTKLSVPITQATPVGSIAAKDAAIDSAWQQSFAGNANHESAGIYYIHTPSATIPVQGGIGANHNITYDAATGAAQYSNPYRFSTPQGTPPPPLTLDLPAYGKANLSLSNGAYAFAGAANPTELNYTQGPINYTAILNTATGSAAVSGALNTAYVLAPDDTVYINTKTGAASLNAEPAYANPANEIIIRNHTGATATLGSLLGTGYPASKQEPLYVKYVEPIAAPAEAGAEGFFAKLGSSLNVHVLEPVAGVLDGSPPLSEQAQLPRPAGPISTRGQGLRSPSLLNTRIQTALLPGEVAASQIAGISRPYLAFIRQDLNNYLSAQQRGAQAAEAAFASQHGLLPQAAEAAVAAQPAAQNAARSVARLLGIRSIPYNPAAQPFVKLLGAQFPAYVGQSLGSYRAAGGLNAEIANALSYPIALPEASARSLASLAGGSGASPTRLATAYNILGSVAPLATPEQAAAFGLGGEALNAGANYLFGRPLAQGQISSAQSGEALAPVFGAAEFAEPFFEGYGGAGAPRFLLKNLPSAAAFGGVGAAQALAQHANPYTGFLAGLGLGYAGASAPALLDRLSPLAPDEASLLREEAIARAERGVLRQNPTLEQVMSQSLRGFAKPDVEQAISNALAEALNPERPLPFLRYAPFQTSALSPAELAFATGQAAPEASLPYYRALIDYLRERASRQELQDILAFSARQPTQAELEAYSGAAARSPRGIALPSTSTLPIAERARLELAALRYAPFIPNAEEIDAYLRQIGAEADLRNLQATLRGAQPAPDEILREILAFSARQPTQAELEAYSGAAAPPPMPIQQNAVSPVTSASPAQAELEAIRSGLITTFGPSASPAQAETPEQENIRPLFSQRARERLSLTPPQGIRINPDGTITLIAPPEAAEVPVSYRTRSITEPELAVEQLPEEEYAERSAGRLPSMRLFQNRYFTYPASLAVEELARILSLLPSSIAAQRYRLTPREELAQPALQLQLPAQPQATAAIPQTIFYQPAVTEGSITKPKKETPAPVPKIQLKGNAEAPRRKRGYGIFRRPHYGASVSTVLFPSLNRLARSKYNPIFAGFTLRPVPTAAHPTVAQPLRNA